MANKDNIIIPKKAMLGIAPVIAISAIIISKHNPGDLLLFWVGISAGVIITKGFLEK